jgi:transcriptional regulator with XRE-family HTH domain
MLNLIVKDAGRTFPYAAPPMESMGARIRRLREAKGYTQPSLAELLGVTKSAISQWEDESTENIKLKTFLRLCDLLGTDPRYLIWGPERVDPEAPLPPKRYER